MHLRWGDNLADKKKEYLTVRLTENVKKLIEQEAQKREWTSSHMAEKILSSWAENLQKITEEQ